MGWRLGKLRLGKHEVTRLITTGLSRVSGKASGVRLRLLVVLAVLGLFPAAGAISYTVQVAALSDQAAARALLEDLRRQGFPVYLVGLPTDSGVIYRLRVGAFANRAAALRYGERMQDLTGLVPVPALAEDTPRLPLEPSLVAAYPLGDGAEATLHTIGASGLALRVQDEGREADYRLLEPGRPRTASAWRLVPLEGGALLRVYSFPLWPAEAGDQSESERRAEEEARLAALARSFGLEAGALSPYVVRPPAAPPLLVRAERWDEGGSESLALVGNPAAWAGGGEGPPLVAPGGDTVPREGSSEALLDLRALLEGGDAVQGDGWQARPDGGFTRLSAEGREWRALEGRPIWAQERYLIVASELAPGALELVLYELSPPD